MLYQRVEGEWVDKQSASCHYFFSNFKMSDIKNELTTDVIRKYHVTVQVV